MYRSWCTATLKGAVMSSNAPYRLLTRRWNESTVSCHDAMVAAASRTSAYTYMHTHISLAYTPSAYNAAYTINAAEQHQCAMTYAILTHAAEQSSILQLRQYSTGLVDDASAAMMGASRSTLAMEAANDRSSDCSCSKEAVMSSVTSSFVSL